MKKLALMGSAALLALSAAASTPQLLVNGEAVDKIPARLTFEGDNVIVDFGSDTQAYDLGDVEIKFQTSGLASFEAYALKVTVGDRLQVQGIADATEVAVYDAAGCLVARTAAAGSSATLDLTACPRGVYILKAGNKHVKFIKN